MSVCRSQSFIDVWRSCVRTLSVCVPFKGALRFLCNYWNLMIIVPTKMATLKLALTEIARGYTTWAPPFWMFNLKYPNIQEQCILYFFWKIYYKSRKPHPHSPYWGKNLVPPYRDEKICPFNSSVLPEHQLWKTLKMYLRIFFIN